MNRRQFIQRLGLAAAALSLARFAPAQAPAARPNIVFIMSDDHAAHALSCYGSPLIETPNLDRIAREGIRFDNCFCTNSICAPSRAVILTGKYSHLNGMLDNVTGPFDGAQQTFPKLLQAAGYETAMIGKWHLQSEPTGFDYYNILPGQGAYVDPAFIENGKRTRYTGYVTDIITDRCIDWLDSRTSEKPFCLMYHHKAPHRNWTPDEKHAAKWRDRQIPWPADLDDDLADYPTRCDAVRDVRLRIADDFLIPRDTKIEPPAGVEGYDLKEWKYQRYMQDYLACVDSVDENVGRFLDYLDHKGLAQNTIVVYTSDQGFFLGDHGLFDKRFMYEESIRMPLLVRWPGVVRPSSTSDAMVLNLDFAATFLKAAGLAIPDDLQGESLVPILRGRTPANWRTSMYYHYYEFTPLLNAKRHYGIRTRTHKLIHYYHDVDCWELFDLAADPAELHNVYDNPAYADVREQLTAELDALQHKYGDSPELARSFIGRPRNNQNR